MLGVLGGMGPEATVDFMLKVIKRTPAACDQEHVPVVVWSVPQVPDRTRAILGTGESPLPQLVRGLEYLRTAGVEVVAIPCNTAHYWYDDLCGAVPVPIFHIVDAVAEIVVRDRPGVSRIGLLATEGTVRSGVYPARLAGKFTTIDVQRQEDQDQVNRGIALAKAGRLLEARACFHVAAERLRDAGAEIIVMGCTEIPLARPDGDDLVDATDALAERCVRWFMETHRGLAPRVTA